ncbi:MAG: FAD-dependent oxidoreductase [Deltaproteobacteria bacterium]|nr:FAD-dependent oxidoreductase [Deltaproteobacteria bacterium]
MMAVKPDKWDLETGVLIVGSGGAALAAAILAHDNGASVTVIERSDKVGGTTSDSGGLTWVPQHHLMAEKGASDSREEALKYCKAVTKGRVSDPLVETYVDTVPEMARYMEEHTPLKYESTSYPDYHPEFEGGHTAEASRSLGPLLFNKNDLGEAASTLRDNRNPGIPMLFSELEKWEAGTKIHQVPFDVIGERMEEGLVGFGAALVGHLYKGLLDRGIEPVLNTRGLELVMEDGEVIGLRAEQGGKDFYIGADKGIILACGGFEWNKDLVAAFLPGPIAYPNSPPYNEGDGLKMAMSAGADLAGMCENWGSISIVIPGEESYDRPYGRISLTERNLPHCIIVNRKGLRFVNESASYNDMFKSFWILNPNTCEYENLPAWHIFDQLYFDKYPCMTIMPGDPIPDYVERGDTVGELARKVGIDPEGLETTVERFNAFAKTGVDQDFQRGESAYDKYYGDKDQKPSPALGPIEKPPFYALPSYTGSIGTKGGARINTNAQALHVSGNPIPGLYAAGNAGAPVSGPGYWGAGGTIGPAMVFGYLAGRHAANRK